MQEECAVGTISNKTLKIFKLEQISNHLSLKEHFLCISHSRLYSPIC